MSVLIKGLELPKDCEDCRFCIGLADTEYGTCAGCLIDGGYREASSKSGCPLVEIPEPHGRLIDADAYCEDLLEEAHRVWGLLKPETIERINRTVDDLKKYPAIIEAEGRKDGENHDD